MYDVQSHLREVLSTLPQGVRLVAVSKFTTVASAFLARAMSRKSDSSTSSCPTTSSGISLAICKPTR